MEELRRGFSTLPRTSIGNAFRSTFWWILTNLRPIRRTFKSWGAGRSRNGDASIRSQYLAYRELKALRDSLPCETSTDGLEVFMGPLLRVTAQDLSTEQIESFSAYRFLYERLLGAKVRPWLPAAFCAAAALPQIRPAQRKILLQSLSEAAATAPGWSDREPCFYPEKVEAEAA